MKNFTDLSRRTSAIVAIFTMMFSYVSPVFAVATSDLTSVSVGTQTGTLTAGIAGTVTYTVTVNRSNSGNGPATMSVTSVLPSGVSVSSFPQASFSGSVSSSTTTLTISTTSSAVAGVVSFTVQASGTNAVSNSGTLTIGAADTTAPTITNITSTTADGSYRAGTVIPINLTFSEAVTSTGNVTVTTDTGRTCTFAVLNATTGSCNYTVQAGDTSSNLNISSISGTIQDVALNPMTNFIPTTNLSTNKAIIIDTTAPTGSFTINNNDTYATSTSATLNFSGVSSDVSILEIRNGIAGSFQTPVPYVNPYSYTLPAGDGAKTVSVRFTDAAGNQSVGVISDSIILETTAPTVSSVDSDGQTYSSSTVSPHTIKVTFSEDIANTPTVSVNGNGQTVNNCADADAKTFCFDYAVPSPTEATETITIAGATDVAGNTMVINNTHTFAVDTIAPSLSFTDPVQVGPVMSDNIAVNYGGATVQKYGFVASAPVCIPTIDVSGFSLYTTNFSVSDTSNNGNYVCIYAEDGASNKSALASIEKLNIDPSTPAIVASNPDTNPAQSKTITASTNLAGTFSMSENSGGVCNGSLTFVGYSNITYTSESDNGKTVCYQVIDEQGNTAYQISSAIGGIDRTAPTAIVTSITSNNANTALAKADDIITVLFTTSETINPLALADITIAGKPADSISNSGNNYTATYKVTSSDAQGTAIVVLNFSDIAGNPGTQTTSTGTDASNVTIDTVAPVQSLVNIIPGNGLISIAFNTNENATSVFSYGATSAYGNNFVVSDVFATTHGEKKLLGIAPCSEYHYSISTTDVAGNISSSSDATLTTLGVGSCSGSSEGGGQGGSPSAGSITEGPREEASSPSTGESNITPETTQPTSNNEVTEGTQVEQPTSANSEEASSPSTGESLTGTPSNEEEAIVSEGTNNEEGTPTEGNALTSSEGGTPATGGETFSPSNATLDIGGGVTPPAPAEGAPAQNTTEESTPEDIGGGVTPPEGGGNATLVWTLLGIVALLNGWWFFATRGKVPPVGRN